MATTPTVSKPPRSESQNELLARASASTANVGWLQDYLMGWLALRAVARRLWKQQLKQKAVDAEVHEWLKMVDHTATDRCEVLQEAFNQMLERHEKLMAQIMEGRD